MLVGKEMHKGGINHAVSYFETVFVLSCDFIYFIYVICLGKLYIREGDMYWKLQGGMLQREGKRMTDLVIKSGDLIRDRHHPREPKHWYDAVRLDATTFVYPK